MNGIVFEKGIFAMIGTIESAIVDLAEHLNVPVEDGEKYGVIHERLLEVCPKLHTRNELEKLARKFIQDFINEFNHRELRIWYECNAPMTFSDEMLQMKYVKLLKNHDTWVDNWLENHNIILLIDAFLLGNEVRSAYSRTSGVDFDRDSEFTLQLWGLVKTIRDSSYDKTLISTLHSKIKTLLRVTGGDYYATLDLTDKEVLKELYYILCEVTHSYDGFRGHNIFYHYDGYGGTVFESTGELIEEW